MSLEIERKEREGITILDLNGRITMGEEVTKFREAIQDLARAANPKLIIDMRQVDYIDSTGLGLMIRTKKFAAREGLSIWFERAQENVRNVVRLSKLDDYLFEKRA